jgi:hypothetical protein
MQSLCAFVIFPNDTKRRGVLEVRGWNISWEASFHVPVWEQEMAEPQIFSILFCFT